MLENLLQMVKEYGQREVVENPDIPDEQNTAVMSVASEAVVGTLQTALANGQMDEVMRMFNSASSSQIMSNPVAQNMQAGFMDNITSKLGINKNVAMGLASTLIPIIISKLVKRTNSTDQADSGFDLSSLIGSLTGGGGGGNSGGFNIGNLISQFTGGGNSGGGGGGGLADIISQVTNGARQQQGGGGLSSLIQGFFGK